MLLPPPPTPPPFAQCAPDGVQKILIGNKADEEHKRQVAKEQGLQVSWGLPGCVVVQVAVAGGPSLGLHGGPLPPPTQLSLCSPAVLPPRFLLQ